MRDEWSGKKVLVEGLGKTGVSVVRTLSSLGASVIVHDVKPSAELSDNLNRISGCSDVQGIFGSPIDEVPAGVETVILSPGVNPKQKWIESARSSGVEVIGDIELFARLIADKNIKLIGITATNGKSTTAALIAHLLRSAGLETFLGGNIGIPALDIFALQKDWEVAVLELSSFQLDTTQSLKLDIALLLNIAPDHLDRYSSFEEYRNSKARIFMNQTDNDWAVLNHDDNDVLTAAQSAKSQKRYFSTTEELPRGAFASSGVVVITDGNKREQYLLNQYQFLARHNVENVMAAVLTACILGLNKQQIERGLSTFKGLPHRLEFVAEYRNVRFYNDSKATNPHATAKALEAFLEPIVWLAGGKNKGLDFSQLYEPAKRKVRKALLFGESAESLAKALGDACETQTFSALKDAFEAAVADVEPGDVVLLSPACASFDEFSNFEERGNFFKTLVNEWIGKQSK